MKTNYENFDLLWRYIHAIHGIVDSITDLPVTKDDAESNPNGGLLTGIELLSERGELLADEYRGAATDYYVAVSAKNENALPEDESGQSAEGIAGQPIKGVETDGPTRR